MFLQCGPHLRIASQQVETVTLPQVQPKRFAEFVKTTVEGGKHRYRRHSRQRQAPETTLMSIQRMHIHRGTPGGK